MIKAILDKGVIRPVEPLPPDWRDGQELVVGTGVGAYGDDADDRWVKGFAESTRAIPDEDHDRLMAAIQEHRREAKEWARQLVGLGMRAGYLLDTNHVGLAVRAGSAVQSRVLAAHRRGVRLGTCVPVLCEIEHGVQYIRHQDVYRRNRDDLLTRVRVWPLDMDTPPIYGRIAARLKQRGRTISQIDMMLASLAEQMNLVLLSTDSDFDELPHIPREDWTKP